MTLTAEPTPDKGTRRRLELAQSALKTLGELGYARTSLREIANNSEYSHGVVHYYFRDKAELISYGVRVYKTTCAQRYDDVIATSVTIEELRERFLAKMVESLRDDVAMHRLWYDLRTQCMFNPELGDDVRAIDALLEDMMWRVLSKFAELGDTTILVDSPTAYALIDGLFEQAVVAYGHDADDAAQQLALRVEQVLPRLLG